MGEHDSTRAPQVSAEPIRARPRPFTATLVGAGFGGLLLVGAGLLLYIPQAATRIKTFGDLGPSAAEEIGKYLLLPGLLGILAGSAVGWSVGITRAMCAVSLIKLILAWGVVGGAIAVLVPAAAFFVWAWIRDEGFSLVALPHQHPPPMSLAAAREALASTCIGVIVFGLPLFTLGSIVGIVVALVKRVDKRNQPT
jgi:ABC-type amino acid transport substrate-binding protein